MIIIYGPTASGKTAFATTLASHLPIEIINMDMGQCYTPLSIGTAKPAWRQSTIAHHGFDIIENPVHYTVMQYRALVLPLIEAIKTRGKIPVLVGGSGFYLKSLLFPPMINFLPKHQPTSHNVSASWEELNTVDPLRAAAIHPHDAYRITRALMLWQTTGIKPSACVPIYAPPYPYLILYITKERDELYAHINERVSTMMQAGWLSEVESLLANEWCPFLQEKKIIGYDDCIRFLTESTPTTVPLLNMLIAQKTRQYAKRQITFARGLQKQLRAITTSSPWLTLNLTLSSVELYIKQILRHPFVTAQQTK